MLSATRNGEKTCVARSQLAEVLHLFSAANESTSSCSLQLQQTIQLSPVDIECTCRRFAPRSGFRATTQVAISKPFPPPANPVLSRLDRWEATCSVRGAIQQLTVLPQRLLLTDRLSATAVKSSKKSCRQLHHGMHHPPLARTRESPLELKV